MNKLLAAAIEEWRKCASITPTSGPALLRAVERAEKQEAVRLSDDEIFDIENNLPDEYIGDIKYTLGFARAIEQTTWTAAQQAERERIKEIVEHVSHLDQDGLGSWVNCCATIMEWIDEC